jgi:general secretion pathway protein D
MKTALSLILVLAASVASAAENIKMYFNNEEITKIIEIYSKASGQKFVVDPGVRGKVSMFIQEPVSVEEAFNQLSTALSINGFAISKQGDTMVIKSARNIQRDLIEVSTELPSLKPERMATWIYTFKNISAEQVNRNMRILASKDGEMNVSSPTNQIYFTDWTSNLNRIAALMKELDKPVDPATTKIVAAAKKEHETRKKDVANKDTEKAPKTEK